MKLASAVAAITLLASPAFAIMGNTTMPVKPAAIVATTDATAQVVTADTAHLMSADCVTGPIQNPDMYGMPSLGVDCGIE